MPVPTPFGTLPPHLHMYRLCMMGKCNGARAFYCMAQRDQVPGSTAFVSTQAVIDLCDRREAALKAASTEAELQAASTME